jgi:hypothetical protein
VAVQFFSIAMSHHPGDSFQKFLLAQIGWTTIFFTSCYVFLQPGQAGRWVALLWCMAIVVSLIGVQENVNGKVPWADHIPSFLKIEDETVIRILSGATREDVYRVQSTFSTPLGLAEYLALALPFVLHFIMGAYHWVIRLAAVITVPFLLFIILATDARLGLIGFFTAGLLYLLVWAVLRWRRSKSDLFGPAIALGYPVIICLAIASTLFVGRIREKVWGSGQYDASTEGRTEMYQKGIPMILQHPFGHGPGMGAAALGITNPAGVLTIDTYYLAIGLDYGILGFFTYYAMILVAISYGAKYAFKSDAQKGEFGFFIPLTISLTNFFVIKSVFSNDDNHPLAFMMMGMIVALVYRFQQVQLREAIAAGASSPGARVKPPASSARRAR